MLPLNPARLDLTVMRGWQANVVRPIESYELRSIRDIVVPEGDLGSPEPL